MKGLKKNEDDKIYRFVQLFWLQTKDKNGKYDFHPFSYRFNTNELYGIENGKTYKMPKSLASYKDNECLPDGFINFVGDRCCMPSQIFIDYQNVGDVVAFYTSYELEKITSNVYSLGDGGAVAHFICKEPKWLNDIYNPYRAWLQTSKLSEKELKKISKLYADTFPILDRLNCTAQTNFEMRTASERVSHAKFLSTNPPKLEKIIWF